MLPDGPEVAKVREMAQALAENARDGIKLNPRVKEASIARMLSYLRIGKPGEPLCPDPTSTVVVHLGEHCILAVVCKQDGSCELSDTAIMRSFKPEDFVECQTHVMDSLKFFGEELTQAP